MDDEIRNLVLRLSCASASQSKKMAPANGVMSLRQDALRRACNGFTRLERLRA